MPIQCNLAPFINIPFYITGAFGEPRTDHTHKGLDLSTGLISDVCSMTAGTVTHSANGLGYGDYIVIKDTTGMSFLYGDLGNRLVQVGDTVSQGQVIGKEGNPSGTSSTGYHVHVEQQDTSNHPYYFTTYESGYYINPAIIMGVPNVVSYSTSYIYNGVIPPTPTPSVQNKFPWVLYARKLRSKHIL